MVGKRVVFNQTVVLFAVFLNLMLKIVKPLYAEVTCPVVLSVLSTYQHTSLGL